MGTHPIFESDFDCLTDKKMMCGGTTDSKPADDAGRKVLDSVKVALLEKAGATGNVELHSYKTQVVAGTNYFMKVKVGETVIHARVFEPLPHTGQPAELHSIEAGDHITIECDIAYF